MTFELRKSLLLITAFFLFIIPSIAQEFVVKLPSDLEGEQVYGRLYVMLSVDDSAEPRFQIEDGPSTQMIFGEDVVGVSPGANITIDNAAFGYPIEKLNGVPAGKYSVQALFHVYETFTRSDGHTVHLPMDRGEGQQWNRAPGNRYSTPTTVSFDPGASNPIVLSLENTIPPIIKTTRRY